ncbi:haloacid dehalogenase hydrolase domain-containing protein 2-like [Tropilaelaps mercedesae]|uniref:Haloacid dehalogenase-like hydrolase domain-containing protein 2 n=1 Tax=Tropilaelaps mercedesae TaxID=418985 RepID=A0A1V9XLF7_9ACAR|nr:haloacid dehalogenase hydrolase domain-containing protein 2-like [Tropilaelaps mercedesae]
MPTPIGSTTFSHSAMSVAKIIRVVLIDLSGTLHVGDKATRDAPAALKRLREVGVKIRFVTNTTKESSTKLHSRLLALGFDIDRNEIFSSLIAARDYVRKHQLRPYLLVHDDAMEDFSELEGRSNLNAVVVGLAPEKFTYNKLNEAFQILLNGGHLIAIHKGRYYRADGGLALGPGPFVAGLEYATGIQAEVVGKPNKLFFQEALQGMTDDPSEAVMIGDDIMDDIQGAMDVGMGAILVKTGKYLAGDEKKSQSRPTAAVADFDQAVDFIIEHNQTKGKKLA